MSKLRNERVWLFCDRVYWRFPRKFRIWLWYCVLHKTLCKLCRACQAIYDNGNVEWLLLFKEANHEF
jgi:hypothetical protein